MEYDFDVAIIGSGPAGIGVATGLVRKGITNIVVFEREAEIGGIPRHTHHASFGILVFKRPMSGPKFIGKLLKRCPNVIFKTNTTVTALDKAGTLTLATKDGAKTITARHIVLATGARETPRHSRLISGLRPQGIMTTGALQQFVYMSKLRPFRRPIIVGSELVSFSALWTLRKNGIKPIAMIEENDRITAYRPAAMFATALGVPIYYNSTITDISSISQTTQIEVEDAKGDRQTIDCDGIIFSGKFVGDNNLAQASHLSLNQATQIPQVDQNWLTSDPVISSIGNSTHPADMGDQCYQEGLIAGNSIAAKLGGETNSSITIQVKHDSAIKMTTPNTVRLSRTGKTAFDLCLHVTFPFTGVIEVTFNDQVIYQKTRRCMPARRIRLKNIQLERALSDNSAALHVMLKAKNARST